MYCRYCYRAITKYDASYSYNHKNYCSKNCLIKYLHKENGTNLILNKWSINNG